MTTDQVLAVDDDPATVATLREALAAVACEAAFAPDAMRAWELLQLVDRPAVLVVGQAMAALGGVALCRGLREQAGRQPYVLLLTDVWRPDDLTAAFRAGVDEHLPKPVAADELARRVRRALRGVAAREAGGRAPALEEDGDAPRDPAAPELAGTLVGERFRVVTPVRSGDGWALWEGLDASTRARAAVWLTRLGGERALGARAREGRRSLLEAAKEAAFTVLDFGAAGGGLSYVATTFCDAWGEARPPAARALDLSAEPTVQLPALRGRIPTRPTPRASSPARPLTLPPPPRAASDPFHSLSNPLMPADESFARVAQAPPASSGTARRRGSRFNLRTALLLVGACAAGAVAANARLPRLRAPVRSIPPPADAGAPVDVLPVALVGPAAEDAAAETRADVTATGDAPARDAAAAAPVRMPAGLDAVLHAGDLAAAERMLSAALAERPDAAALHARLGLVHFWRGNNARALASYRQAAELDRLNVSHLRWIARLQEATGDRRGAARTLRGLLTLAPRDPAATRALQRLEPGA